jgi:hypothetical protein
MQHAKWFCLDDIREISDQLDNRAKSIIPGYELPCYLPFKQKANLHDISAHVIIQKYASELEDPEMYEQKDILKIPDKYGVDDDPPNSLDTPSVNTETLSNPIKLSPAD